jgi:hypothetical protein
VADKEAWTKAIDENVCLSRRRFGCERAAKGPRKGNGVPRVRARDGNNVPRREGRRELASFSFQETRFRDRSISRNSCNPRTRRIFADAKEKGYSVQCFRFLIHVYTNVCTTEVISGRACRRCSPLRDLKDRNLRDQKGQLILERWNREGEVA